MLNGSMNSIISSLQLKIYACDLDKDMLIKTTKKESIFKITFMLESTKMNWFFLSLPPHSKWHYPKCLPYFAMYNAHPCF